MAWIIWAGVIMMPYPNDSEARVELSQRRGATGLADSFSSIRAASSRPSRWK